MPAALKSSAAPVGPGRARRPCQPPTAARESTSLPDPYLHGNHVLPGTGSPNSTVAHEHWQAYAVHPSRTRSFDCSFAAQTYDVHIAVLLEAPWNMTAPSAVMTHHFALTVGDPAQQEAQPGQALLVRQ